MSQRRDNEVGWGSRFCSSPPIVIFLLSVGELLEQPFLQQVGIRRRCPGWQG